MQRAALLSVVLLGCGDPAAADLDVQPVLARAARLLVDDDRAQCPTARWTSVQAAVDAALPGETVEICAGRYGESVRVGKTLRIVGPRRGIDGRTRTLDSPGEAVIATSRPFTLDADGVVLDGLTLQVIPDETGEGWGVLSRSTISGTLIQNCVLDADGVTAFFPGSSGVLRTVAKRNHFYHRLGVASSGDEPYAPARYLLVTENLFTGSSIGLFSGEDDGVVVSHNRFEGGSGIALVGVQDARVYGNTLVDLTQDGIRVDRSRSAWISDNVLSGGAGDGVRLTGDSTLVKVQRASIGGFTRGIFLQQSRGNQVLDNDVSGSLELGIVVDVESSGNRLADNVVTGSGLLDCQDASTGAGTLGTANKWVRNAGETSRPAGSCR
jgi:parallel beta-helix repeat protein